MPAAVAAPRAPVPVAAQIQSSKVVCWSHNCREESKIDAALVDFGSRGGLHYNDLRCPRCEAEWRQFVFCG